MQAPIILNVGREMGGRLDGDAIVPKVNGWIILAFMRRPENMFCFTIPEAVMDIGFLDTNVLKFNEKEKRE